jgi:hypothetical protein
VALEVAPTAKLAVPEGQGAQLEGGEAYVPRGQVDAVKGHVEEPSLENVEAAQAEQLALPELEENLPAGHTTQVSYEVARGVEEARPAGHRLQGPVPCDHAPKEQQVVAPSLLKKLARQGIHGVAAFIAR